MTRYATTYTHLFKDVYDDDRRIDYPDYDGHQEHRTDQELTPVTPKGTCPWRLVDTCVTRFRIYWTWEKSK